MRLERVSDETTWVEYGLHSMSEGGLLLRGQRELLRITEEVGERYGRPLVAKRHRIVSATIRGNELWMRGGYS